MEKGPGKTVLKISDIIILGPSESISDVKNKTVVMILDYLFYLNSYCLLIDYHNNDNDNDVNNIPIGPYLLQLSCFQESPRHP